MYVIENRHVFSDMKRAVQSKDTILELRLHFLHFM